MAYSYSHPPHFSSDHGLTPSSCWGTHAAPTAANAHTASSVRIDLGVALRYEVGPGGADFVFNIHAAQTAQQQVSHERLTISQNISHQVHVQAATGNRCLRLHAEPGPLEIDYRAIVDIHHHRSAPEGLCEVPTRCLPQAVMEYIYPSRYSQSDRLLAFAFKEFGGLAPGYSRVQAICNWVHEHVAFTPNSSTPHTAAVDTLVDRVGVCRDFAHLMIALCRASNIPARFTTGTDYGADPALGPPDFHAYVEVYVGDRWYLFDPSGTAIPMGLVRLSTGRDAADVAFATIFGSAQVHPPVIRGLAIHSPEHDWLVPTHCQDALSTDGPSLAENFAHSGTYAALHPVLTPSPQTHFLR